MPPALYHQTLALHLETVQVLEFPSNFIQFTLTCCDTGGGGLGGLTKLFENSVATKRHNASLWRLNVRDCVGESGRKREERQDTCCLKST